MRLCILISAVCVLTAFGSVQPQPAFDPQAVVRQVRSAHSSPSLLSPHSSLLPVDGEFLLDTSSTLVPAPGSQTDVAIGFDGTNFLVAWQDLRGGNYWDVCGTRVTTDGTVLDPAGFVISQAAYDQQCPALAFDGANFLVVWQDYRRGYAYDIYGTRVTPQGTVLDGFGIIISQQADDQQHPAVAFDGADFLVAWEDYRNSVQEPDIYGARVMPDGTVLDTAGLVISQATNSQYAPVVGFDGANSLVAWSDCRHGGPEQADIYGARVTPQGTVLDPQGFIIGNLVWSQVSPTLAFDGANFLVAWQDIHPGSLPPVIGIYGARVTPQGTVLDPSGITIAKGTDGVHPALGFDGANFLVVWYEAHGFPVCCYSIWGKRVTPDGEVLDDGGIVISAPAVRFQQTPVACFGGGNFLVAWQDDRNKPGEPDIYGTRVTPGGTVVDTSGFLITLTARGQYTPALGFDGATFLVVWEDDRGGYTDIYGARVTPGGTVLDLNGFVISQAPNWQYEPALAFDGTSFFVVWQDYRHSLSDPDIYGARVTPGGTVLDPNGILISDAPNRQFSPAVAFGGASFLVVWQDDRSGTYDIYGTRVTTGGTVLNTDGIVITQAPYQQRYPVLGFDGANYLAVWEDYRGGDGYGHIYGTRIRPNGTVLDPNGIVISQAAYGQYTPAFAFDGTNYLVAWEDYRHSSVWPDVFGARVTTAGAVLDTAGIAISTASKDQFAPALAFDGTNYLVVYEDYRGSNNPDIYGAWVAPDGTVSDEGGVLRIGGNQTGLALARGTGSLLFLVYQGWTGTVGDKIYNTDRIWGKMHPMPGGGIEEGQQPTAYGLRPMATIVRGVLFLPPSSLRLHPSSLLSIDGRKVLDLKAGANDVSGLAPGVYFVRAVGCEPSAVSCSKVVVTR